MLFQCVQILYWMALSTWFGAVLFAALSAPIIFRTVRESNPVLPDVLSVNLDNQHSTLLAGTIVTNILRRLVYLELICGGVLLIALAIHPFIINMSGAAGVLSSNQTAAMLRSLMFLGATAAVLFDWLVVWPKLLKSRALYIEHADEPEVANPAKDEFDREHHRSVSVMSIVLFLLLGMILFSGNIMPKPQAVTVASAGQP
jgi:hypothetical protein